MQPHFSVLNVVLAAKPQNRFGSIADRPFLPKTTAASGRNFMSAIAKQFGGDGAAIARPLNLPTKNENSLPRAVSTRLKNERGIF